MWDRLKQVLVQVLVLEVPVDIFFLLLILAGC